MKQKLSCAAAVVLMALATPAWANPAAPTTDAAALARASGCMWCHAVDRRMVGPSFRDISARYAGQADAARRMASVIQRGGAGVWGSIPMPANARLSDADAARLAAWSLSHR